KCAIANCPITLSMRAQVVLAGAAQRAHATNARGRLAHHAVPDLPVAHIISDRGDHTGRLMTQHYGQFDLPALAVAPHVNVGATHAHRARFEQHVPGLELGFWHIAQFNVAVFKSKFYERFHLSPPAESSGFATESKPAAA